MKIEKNSRYTTIAIYAFAVIAAALLFFELIRNISSVLGFMGKVAGYIMPVIYGFVFAFVLNPMLRMFENRLLPKIPVAAKLRPRVKRRISIALTYLVAAVLVSIFLSMVLPQVISSLSSVVNSFDEYLTMITNVYNSFIAQLEFMRNPESSVIMQNISASILGTVEGLFGLIDDVFKQVLTAVMPAAARFTTGVVNIILGVIISIYFLSDREKLFAQLKKIVQALFNPRTSQLLYDIAQESNRVFNGFIVGKVIDSIIIGILCFIGMCFICPQYAMLIALIIGVTNIIPYFGPFIGAIPSFFLVFISETGGPVRSLVFLIFILLLQQFDGNILGPKILGDTTGLSALWVVFSIMLFSGMFGVLGMFIGVPLFAVFYSMVKRTVSHLLRKKGRSPHTRDYASDKNPLI